MKLFNYIIVITCNTQKNVFIYFVIIIYIITWGCGWMVKVIDEEVKF